MSARYIAKRSRHLHLGSTHAPRNGTFAPRVVGGPGRPAQSRVWLCLAGLLLHLRLDCRKFLIAERPDHRLRCQLVKDGNPGFEDGLDRDVRAAVLRCEGLHAQKVADGDPLGTVPLESDHLVAEVLGDCAGTPMPRPSIRHSKRNRVPSPSGGLQAMCSAFDRRTSSSV